MTTELCAARCRQALTEHTRRLADAAVAAGGDAQVPTCPEWTVAHLVEHVGQTQHWVSQIIERRITNPMELPTEMATMPGDSAQWPAWLSESAGGAAAACSDAALDAAVFNPAGDDRPGTRFWLYSLLNEAVVHGFDAAMTASRPNDVDADIAAALVGNHLAMLTSPTWAAQRPESAQAIRGGGETLRWDATDRPGHEQVGDWLVERLPDGATWQPAPGQADVTVHGPARSLLLILTRRLPLTGAGADVSIDGDVDLAQHWVDNTAHVSG